MFFRILKKDLKRKKVMNVIILLFVTLSALFVASSMNNIVAVVNGLDNYFEKADMPDYIIMTMAEKEETGFAEQLSACSDKNVIKAEEMIALGLGSLKAEGKDELQSTSTFLLMPIGHAAIHYFDKDGNVITEIEEGKIYVPQKCLKDGEMAVGDTLTTEFGGQRFSFEVVGSAKDAVLGTERMGAFRLFISEKDFNRICETEVAEGSRACVYNVYGEEAEKTAAAVNGEASVVFAMTKAEFKSVYLLDMVVSGAILVVSICLILIAFVVLRFTILFTLNEEFREIGVMKAIGIPNGKIRFLYIIKYLILASVGAFAGLLGSIPLSKVLLSGVGRNILLGNDNAMLINVLSCLFVVAVIVAFCFFCTRKVKKLAPVDAVRDGTTGERFAKKRGLRLGKMRTKPAFFLALNDVISSLRRYLTAIVAFTLCLLLILILVNTANTIESGDMLQYFCMRDCDLGFAPAQLAIGEFLEGGAAELCRDKLEKTERLMEEKGCPGRCTVDLQYKLSFTYGEKSYKSVAFCGIGTTTDEYRYYAGTAPRYANEIAVTPVVAEKLGVNIGDSVRVSGLEGEFLVTALFQSMVSLGEGVRFHESTDLSAVNAVGCMLFQISFDDRPDRKTIAQRAALLKEGLGTNTVMTAEESVDYFAGVADILDALKLLVAVLTLIITALVTVLMERSFISNEHREIALEKAIGLKDGTVIAHHTLRFVIIGVSSVVLALLLALPVTHLAVTPIFGIMGIRGGMEYAVNPTEIFLVYPALVLGTTMLFAFLTSLYTKKIQASDTSSNE